MIKFCYLTTGDKDVIQRFTLWGDRMNCDLSFANLISWSFLYNTQYAIVDDYLVFRFYAGHHLAYMMPLPKPRRMDDGTYKVEPCDECSVNVIRAIRDDSIAMGHPFLLLGVCDYMTGVIEEAFPDTFQIKPDRDYADYIYTREKLSTLAGKKLQSKRNHINKFRNLYPDYVYRELTPELIPECLKLERQWRNSQEEPDQEESMTEELRSMTRAFNRWDRLGLIGGTIWVGGKLIAFTFGCPINRQTFDVCVEKADTSYEGSFTIINQEFVKHLPEQYVYINREEDMGEEGLRNAKLSYKPDILLMKNVIMEKYPLADFEDQDRILKETRELWKQSFGDDEAFMDMYFNHIYKSEYNITCQINHHVVAALQTLPYPMLYHGRELPTAYMSGVCVHPDYRRQDIGNNLMRQAHFSLYYKEAIFAALIPAEPWLYEWYGKCGYAQCITCTPPPAETVLTTFARFDEWQRQKDCILLHDEAALGHVKEDIAQQGDDYEPATEPEQAMLRVINARKALEAYLSQHPATTCVLHVQDDQDIPMNNAYYILRDGKVRQTDEPIADAQRMTPNQLAEFLFKEENAEMTLMLE